MRICDVCGRLMDNGYVIDGGNGVFYHNENNDLINTGAYFCSDECLHTQITDDEWIELYNDGDSQSYWTEWELADADWICYHENNKKDYIDFIDLNGTCIDDRISIPKAFFEQHLLKELKRVPSHDDLEFFLNNLCTIDANNYRKWIRYHEVDDDLFFFLDLNSDNSEARIHIKKEWLKFHCEVNNLNFSDFVDTLTAEMISNIDSWLNYYIFDDGYEVYFPFFDGSNRYKYRWITDIWMMFYVSQNVEVGVSKIDFFNQLTLKDWNDLYACFFDTTYPYERIPKSSLKPSPMASIC